MADFPPVDSNNADDLNDLFTDVYDELKRLALMHMAQERGNHTLTPTALLHEAYVRVSESRSIPAPTSRIHFCAMASAAMRRILVEHARKHGRRQRLLLDEVAAELESRPVDERNLTDLVALDAALDKLAIAHPEKSRLVQIRYFGGLTMAEAAEVMLVSLSSANRDWAFARAWLARELVD